MKIGVFGTGMVGAAIANKLVALGHEVKMGSRTANNEKAVAWAKAAGAKASQGTFADSARLRRADLQLHPRDGTLDALQAAGAANLKGKILIDISNPLDFSKGMPPTLFAGNTDSLGERIQAAFPETKVIKTLNTVTAEIMVDPGKIGGGDHVMFISGNDTAAKATVGEFLKTQFGWKDILDLGDITTVARHRVLPAAVDPPVGRAEDADFNVKIVN